MVPDSVMEPPRPPARQAPGGDLRARPKALHELNAVSWKKRGLLHRAQDNALYLFNEVL
jgi:hypothetical protein